MICHRMDQKKVKTHYETSSAKQTTIESNFEIRDGDLAYMRDNGLVSKGFVYDDTNTEWMLDEDGNWPEVY